MVTGGMLSAYVITWYSALRDAPATVVTSLLVGAAVITGVLTAATAGKTPSPTVVAGYLLVLAGVGAIGLVATRPRGTPMHVATPPSPDASADGTAPPPAARCCSPGTPTARTGSACAGRTMPRACSARRRPAATNASSGGWRRGSRAPTRTSS